MITALLRTKQVEQIWNDSNATYEIRHKTWNDVVDNMQNSMFECGPVGSALKESKQAYEF